MRISVGQEVALTQAAELLHNQRFEFDPGDPDPTPERNVIDWLGSLRLLKGVPFEYVVPDHGLLLPETIRFFHVDRNWTDVAVEGALSAGAFGTRDRTLLERQRDDIRDAVDDAERSQWLEKPVTGSAATPAGLLLRSRAVSGWPALEAVAWRGDKPLSLLRMERLAPAVLLVIWDNIPTAVELREPRQGIQFGVISKQPSGYHVPLRRITSDDTVEEVIDNGSEVTVDVPFRRGAAGVINVEELAERLLAEDSSAGLGSTLDSAEFAVQMLRYPVVQRFADVDLPADNNALDPAHSGVLRGSIQIADAAKYLDDFQVTWTHRHG